MKLLILFTLFFVGCKTIEEKPTEPLKVLAWGIEKPHWDKSLREAVKMIPANTKTTCKKLDVSECSAQLISKMAQYESSFKPDTTYKEGFNDAKGRPVISRGLLQLSIESANQSAYACGIKEAQELHDPEVNLKCAAKIVAYWAKKDGVLIGQPKKGCARYWSVCRESSGSYKKIMSYMEQF